MAVTKRTRYEVLRRDNHTCRYCGGRAPEVVLTVDHVVPVALGGGDDPSNLVAACRDCNVGKASSRPDTELVADVAQDALRWSAAMRSAADAAVADVVAAAGYRDAFRAAWGTYTYGWAEREYPLPAGWERSVDRWCAAAFPAKLLDDSIRVAMAGPAGREDKFRYLAGVVNRRVQGLAEHARLLLAPEPSAPADRTDGPCGHCGVCVHPERHDPGEVCEASPSHPDAHECDLCHQVGCLYQVGHSDGFHDGWQLGESFGTANARKAARYWTSDPLESLKIPAGALPYYTPPAPRWAE